MIRPPPRSTLSPYTTLSRSLGPPQGPESTQHTGHQEGERHDEDRTGQLTDGKPVMDGGGDGGQQQQEGEADGQQVAEPVHAAEDRKSTRLNSSHLVISYAVF